MFLFWQVCSLQLVKKKDEKEAEKNIDEENADTNDHWWLWCICCCSSSMTRCSIYHSLCTLEVKGERERESEEGGGEEEEEDDERSRDLFSLFFALKKNKINSRDRSTD